MRPKCQKDRSEKPLSAGSHDYRAFVGPPENYDLVSAMQFNLLTLLGLREHHFLLDVGCGSLRGGKLFIPYLMAEHYFGIEPEQWLIEEGLRQEIGDDIVDIKRPVFSNDDQFTLTVFNRNFDFILAQSIFSHASQKQIRRCLSEGKRVMNPNSLFAATFVQGEQNYTAEKWVYPGCVTYTLEHMIELVEAEGLVCKPIRWPHPNQQTWLIIFGPEKERDISEFDDITQILNLRNELRFCQERLKRMESHPYVKLGLKINRLVQGLRQRRR